MKMLHVIHSANPAGGGPIEAVKQLAGALEGSGHSVELVCLDAPGAPWLSGFPFPVHAVGPSSLSYGYSLRLVPWMREHQGDYDVVIVNGLWQFSGFGTWCALRNLARPYCVFPHGMLDPWFKRRYPLKHLKKWLYWPWAEYRVLRDAATVLFTCEEERLQARRSFWLYRCNETVVNFGTAGPVGEAEGQRVAFLEKFPHLRDRRLLLFLGRFHEKKGCMELVEAFAHLIAAHREETEGLALVMAGPIEGEYARAVQRAVERLGLASRVTWTGMLSGDLKWGAFRAAEAFVLPSHQENFGIAVAEALACGTPVLISNKVNIWREIEQDRAGLVENDDMAGTVRLLERWLALDRARRSETRQAARGCFERRFEIGQAAQSLVCALEAAMKTKQ
jgi:glycosyltransferase involved in cell wall biosynthesis